MTRKFSPSARQKYLSHIQVSVICPYYYQRSCNRNETTVATVDKTPFVSGIVGCYQRANPENDWHYVQITWDENADSFTWENRAKSSWSLTLIPVGGGWNTTHLAVGPENPYFNYGHKFAGLEWKGVPGASELSAIRGPWHEAYQRTACPGKYHTPHHVDVM